MKVVEKVFSITIRFTGALLSLSEKKIMYLFIIRVYKLELTNDKRVIQQQEKSINISAFYPMTYYKIIPSIYP